MEGGEVGERNDPREAEAVKTDGTGTAGRLQPTVAWARGSCRGRTAGGAGGPSTAEGA